MAASGQSVCLACQPLHPRKEWVEGLAKPDYRSSLDHSNPTSLTSSVRILAASITCSVRIVTVWSLLMGVPQTEFSDHPTWPQVQ